MLRHSRRAHLALAFALYRHHGFVITGITLIERSDNEPAYQWDYKQTGTDQRRRRGSHPMVDGLILDAGDARVA